MAIENEILYLKFERSTFLEIAEMITGKEKQDIIGIIVSEIILP